MNSYKFWRQWFLVACIFVVALGVFMVFSALLPFGDDMNRPITKAFWRSEVPTEAKDLLRWIYAVLGATMAGWGTTLTFLANRPFKEKQKWAWNAAAAGALVWFPLDTAMSLHFGVYFNALIVNVTLFLLLFLPLLFMRKQFYS